MSKKNNFQKGKNTAEIDPPFYISPLTDFGVKKLFCSDRRGAERLLALLKSSRTRKIMFFLKKHYFVF